MARRPSRQQRLRFERPPHSLTSGDLTRPDPSQTLWCDPETGRKYLISIEWAVVRGRPEPVAFTVRGDGDPPAAIPATLFRRLAPGDIIDQARRDAGRDYTAWREAHPDAEPEPTMTEAGQEWAFDRLLAAQSAAFHDREGMTPMQQELVRVWWQAWHAGQPTTKAVAAHFKITYTNASARVSRTRAAGYLPPTTPGRALAELSQPPQRSRTTAKGQRERTRKAASTRNATR